MGSTERHQYLMDLIEKLRKDVEKNKSQITLARINHRLHKEIIRRDEENAVMRRENDALRQTVATLDEKVTALLAKVDELENDSIVNDYLLNQRVDRSQDDIGELQRMVLPRHLTEYPQ